MATRLIKLVVVVFVDIHSLCQGVLVEVSLQLLEVLSLTLEVIIVEEVFNSFTRLMESIITIFIGLKILASFLKTFIEVIMVDMVTH